MPRRPTYERTQARDFLEQSRDDASRRLVDSLPDPQRPLGPTVFVRDGDRLEFGIVALADCRSALTLYLPVPGQADIGKVITVVRQVGSGTITLALSGSTVDTSATYTITYPTASAMLLAYAGSSWTVL